MPFVPDEVTAPAPTAKRPRFVPDAPVNNDILSDAGMDQLSRTGSALAPAQPKKVPTQGDYAAAAVKRLPELVGGVGETILSGLTGAAASASNIVNAVTGAKEFFKAPGASDADYYAEARDNLTYSPRTQVGKDIGEGFANTVGKVVGSGAQGVEQLTGSPAARELFTDAVNVGGAAAGVRGAKAAKPAPKPDALPVRTKISETPVPSLKEGGYALGPRDKRAIAPTQKGTLKDKAVSALEGIAGREEVADLRALNNQGTTTKHIGRGLGFSDKITAITPKMLETKRAPHIAKYGEVGQTVGKFKPSDEFSRALDSIANKEGIDPDLRPIISKIVDEYRYANMSGPDAVASVNALRSKARRDRRSEDSNTLDRGEARQAIADAIEDEMGRALEASGNQKLLDEWRQARTALAKINEADTALVGGQIDAKVFRRLRDRGAPLSGEAALVADAAEHLQQGTRHSQSVAKGADVSGPKGSPFTDVISLGARPWLREKLAQPPTPKKIGPGSSLSDYFDQPAPPTPPAPRPGPGPGPGPTPASSQLRAQQLAGDSELAPEPVPNAQRLPEAPPRMTAETPPAQRGDIEFTPSKPQAANLAEDFGVDDFQMPGGLEFTPSSPRAAGMADDVPGTKLFPELRAIRGKELKPITGLSLVDDIGGLPPGRGPEGGPAPRGGSPEPSLGEQFGIEVTPNAAEPGFFDVKLPGDKIGISVKAEDVNSFVEDLIGDMLSDEQLVSQPLPEAMPPVQGGRHSGFGTLENNASGESAASVEAINRVKSEKDAGRTRLAIDPDGNATPLQGVDAVDATAPKGRMIVQRGVGRNEYSILDRGGLSITQANGLMNRFLAQLKRDE